MVIKDRAKLQIQQLVKKYESAKTSHLTSGYSEEETKKDFISPLFQALGWAMNDKNEVTAEESQSSGRLDYGFYLEGKPKFFLEAKSFKTDLNKEEFANQAVKYSWNKGVTWAVLTDFESIKVFNAQNIDSALADKLFFEIKYTEYLNRFEQLWLLSKESFEKDLLDEEAEKYGKKLQKVSVTSLLYKDLDKCREILTRDLSQWNPKIDSDLIDEGVQKLLDRLIFLRVAEDRGIEPPILIPLIREWDLKGRKEHLYQSMVEKFREFDAIYNSNLFSEHPFEKWEEYSGATEKVINILYGKKGYYEYDFQAMPADILGSIYENYLGYKLNKSKKGLTVSKDAKKRKEHGIYYTPVFIVDYIVKNTLKPVLDKCNSIEDLKKIKVLDPACGSGSFLIKALEVIYDKYKDFGNPGGVYTKINILLENIYGVDLDPQAVEIARLNLLISALDTRMMLPGLDKNIRNGNSLISGTDEELKKYFGNNFRDKKPFNWKEEFPEVFKQGGFDVIIGNPPYLFSRENLSTEEKNFFYKTYQLTQFKLNTYILFIEKSFNLLNRAGSLSFIIPNNWLTLENTSDLREFCLTNAFDIDIVDVIDKVFQSASVDNSILTLKKKGKAVITLSKMDESGVHKIVQSSAQKYLEFPNYVISFSDGSTDFKRDLCKKISSISSSLGAVVEVKNGVQAYTVGEGSPTQTEEMKRNRVYHSKEKIDDFWIKYVDGVDIHRYWLGWSGQYIKYGKNLTRPRKVELFQGERLLVRQIPAKPPYSILAAFTQETLINDNNGMILRIINNDLKIYYILGLLNSQLMSFWFNTTFNKFQRKIFPQFKVNELAQFPIFLASKDQQKAIENLVDKILDLNTELSKCQKDSNKWNSMQSEIEKTDKKIDEEVYKLYGLTPEEIEVVEGKNES